MDPEIERWRKYLRQDPTRFLLDDQADPSVYLWYLIDIAHRPEDASVVVQARERVLYSQPVQDILAAQQPEGLWGPASSLADPPYRATLWNLALLAELGIPRDSRRARAACESVLQSFLEPDGKFRGVSPVQSGYLLHALGYFGLGRDERVVQAREALYKEASSAKTGNVSRLMALWSMPSFPAAQDALAIRPILEDQNGFGPITFPPFDPNDGLFVLRVLVSHFAPTGPAEKRLVDEMVRKQDAKAQWPLERSLNGSLVTRLEDESSASRWATLNALRVIVKLVQNEDGPISRRGG